jgi:GTP-binding protein Era
VSVAPETEHRSGFVAVVGRPNVGKSSLMNAYLGQKIAIVSPKPQTTRHSQLGILTEAEYQIAFVDTPGLHEPRHALGHYMVETAARALLDADVVVFIVDASTPPTADDVHCAQRLRDKPGIAPVILALNKSDALRPEDVRPNSDAYRELVPGAEWMLVSATRGDNLDALLDMIVRSLPEGPALYPEDELTQTHLRDLAAELVREAALHTLEQEVPHGVAVEVEEFDESRPGLVRVLATLYVEREAHKPIVIGKGGSKLKEIGSRARLEIERLVEQKVYLEVRVKVRKDWRKDEGEVRRLGYRADR